MAPMDAIWLALALIDAIWLALPATSWLPARPPPSHPIGVLLILATPVKNYLKWQEIQLAIHPIVGG